MGLGKMHISTKLWVFISTVIVLIAMVAVVGLLRSASILAEGRARQAVATELVQITTEWAGLTQTNAARNQAILLSDGPKVEEIFKDAVTATSAQIGELQKKIESMPLTEADKAQMQKIGTLRQKVIDLRVKAREAKKAGNAEQSMQVLNTEYLPTMAQYVAAQKEMVELQKVRVQEIATETEQRRGGNSVGILVGLAVVIAVVFAGTLWLVRSIREPLDRANALAARIAAGDLSAHIDNDRHDEFGQLLNSLQHMNQSLARMVSEVRSSTDNIATASAEIAQGNADLAHRTEQTSANLQSTASSMDHLTGTVQHSADNARQASQLAANASSVAQRGGEVVTQVVSTMQQIDASSKKIADIISVIDGIAFQTNILALNAAVEAARAGEQGRGFAVVASEVRSLAGRSAEAAKEIKSLIVTSVEKVETGTQLVTDAGRTMDDIVQSVRRVADVIGEITAAATEQSSGIAGVNQSIGDLDQMTQQNAALVEESAAAAESLREQAERLKQVVAVFKVGAAQVVEAPRLQVRAPAVAAKPYPGAERRQGPAAPPRPVATKKPAPAPSAAAEDDWETF